jgi:hypothetical protein
MKRILAACATVLLLAGCTNAASPGTPGTTGTGQTSASAKVASNQHQVEFKLTTSLKLKVSYGLISNMKTATSNGNWSDTMSSAGNDLADLSFTPVDYADAADAADVTCEILVDGESKTKESVNAIGGKCFYQIP